MPKQWKTANVVGIFKNGNKSDPGNYRPVSLTCISSKILEHIVHSHVMKHLGKFNILSDVQHGFRAKRSTETQLILTIHDMAKAINDNKSVHAVVLDFSKAFDKVPHQRLLQKLWYYGIHGSLFNWFDSFLQERFQMVVCEGKSSQPVSVTSGVPQGTVLGPLLFLVYINDLPDGLSSNVRLFADDALVYRVIVGDAECDQLQNNLIKLEQWQLKWQMEFNPTKCKVIRVSTKKSEPNKTYMFCGKQLEQVTSISYLGLTVTDKLRWSDHISAISNKASKTLGMIKRNFWFCPKVVKESLYMSIVRPKLEYASSVWDPYTYKDKYMVERVQRKAAQFCLRNYKPMESVTDMLKDLGWDTLELRRKKARLTTMYKMSHNLLDMNLENHLVPHTETRTRGSHPFKFRVPKINKDVYKFSYFPQTIKEWNKLPENVVNSDSVGLFKSNLDEFLMCV